MGTAVATATTALRDTPLRELGIAVIAIATGTPIDVADALPPRPTTAISATTGLDYKVKRRRAEGVVLAAAVVRSGCSA